MIADSSIDIFTLKNGLQVVHQQVNSPIAHCGLYINAGTRDELDSESGLAHFIEHAIFKGTKKRRAYHILNRLDSVGGEIDAFTTKELTCYYASFLTEYYDRAIDLISDISFNSQFPEKELAKEKEVILDEINVYKDSPSDLIYDEFEAQVFAKHALGNPILGTSQSVKTLQRENILHFIKRLYHPENMVFTSVGNLSTKALKRKVEKYFLAISPGKALIDRKAFKPKTGKECREDKGTYQSHLMLGKSAYGLNHPKRLSLVLLNNILGGPAMNSILNLKVREKYGFTYHIESNYSVYSDIGLLSIYLGTDPKYLDACIKAVYRELKVLREKKLSTNKLHLSKQQLKGQIAIGRESNSNLMLSQGKNLLMRGKIISLKESYAAIDRLSSEDLLDVANEMLDPKLFDTLHYEGKN